MLKKFLHLLWPTSCPICGAIGQDLCPSCCSQLMVPSGPACLLCEGPVPCPIHGDLEWYSATPHSGMAREMVLSLKYGGWARVGLEMGKQMASVMPKPDHGILVPIPLHRGSPRKYNQARWLAMGIGKAWGLPIMDRLKWKISLSCQTSLDGSKRSQMPKEALSWRGPSLKGVQVVIVDDVKTTGTTLYRANQALKEACSGKIRFLTWSRSVTVNLKGGTSHGT